MGGGQGRGEGGDKKEDAEVGEKQQLQEGDGLEVCPLSLAACEDIGKRVTKSGGAALIIDYGYDFVVEDSLRGFYKHTQVDVLSKPGHVDVTADVDFAACAHAAVSKGAHAHPLLTQGHFLLSMGIVERVQALIDAPSTSEEQANLLVEALKRLVDPKEMGSLYKALVVSSPNLKLPS